MMSNRSLSNFTRLKYAASSSPMLRYLSTRMILNALSPTQSGGGVVLGVMNKQSKSEKAHVSAFLSTELRADNDPVDNHIFHVFKQPPVYTTVTITETM